MLFGVDANATFLRHQAALRGRDELWRASQYPAILDTCHKMVMIVLDCSRPLFVPFVTQCQGFQVSAQGESSVSRVSAASSPLPAKAAAPAAAVAPKEVAPVPAPKAFAISSVPVVKVSGPLLRSCSKAVSTILGDPDMIWFTSPGAITQARKRTRVSSATPCPAPLAPYSDRTRMITVC